MTTFVLTNLGNPMAGQPLWVKSIEANGRPDMVGIMRWDEAMTFASEAEAMAALAAINPRTAAFYKVAAQPARSPFPNIGGNGWMVGHPGYDLK